MVSSKYQSFQIPGELQTSAKMKSQQIAVKFAEIERFSNVWKNDP